MANKAEKFVARVANEHKYSRDAEYICDKIYWAIVDKFSLVGTGKKMPPEYRAAYHNFVERIVGND